MKIGAFLQACRERAGLSQEEIADRLNMTQSTISRIEKNRVAATIDTVMDWVDTTESRELAVAYIFGMDSVRIMEHQKPVEARAQ